MKIALIGYGKMGKMIEQIAKARGHEIVCIIDADNQDAFNSKEFAEADVAIEFTIPDKAVTNIHKAWDKGLPVVSGTTGWNDAMPTIQDEIKNNGKTLFWSSNFSLGVNIFFELNRKLAKIMNEFKSYDVRIEEIHHTQKKDAPSGTAVTLANDIVKNVDRLKNWCLDNNAKSEVSTLPIKAIREGNVPGTHIIRYESDVDMIEIKHEAKGREGFALGAVLAAEFTIGKSGLLKMEDMIGHLICHNSLSTNN